MSDEMSVEIKGKKVVITLPLIDPPKPSSSGKTELIASTSGNKKSGVNHKGREITVGCNAYIYPKE